MCVIYIIGIVNAKEAESLNPNHDVDVPTEYISEGEDSYRTVMENPLVIMKWSTGIVT